MLWVRKVPILKQESASLVTTKMIASAAIPESGLVQEHIMMTPTRVETRLNTHQIMESNTSKPLDIFWFSEKENNHDDKPLNRLP